MNRTVFYDDVRKTVFRGSFSQSQFEGMERLLNVWNEYYSEFNPKILAYLLATSYHETAHTMQPIVERGSKAYFNRYDIQHNPRKAKELGNVNPGDGYRYRGEGDVQNTGRRNARISSDRLNEKFNLDVDFEEKPSQRGDPMLSAHCLYLGCIEGWWTGKKLTQYITDAETDYRNARRVVNGTDRADLIAGYARAFEEALESSLAAPPPEIEVAAPVTGKRALASTTNIAATVTGGAAVVSTVASTAEEVKGVIGENFELLLYVLLGVCLLGAAYIIKERLLKSRVKGV